MSLISNCKLKLQFLGFREPKYCQASINLLPDVSDLHNLPTRKHKSDCTNSQYLITGKLLRLSSAPRLFCVSLLVWSGGCSKELQECERRGKPTMLLEPPKSCTQATCIVPVVPCAQNKLPLKERHNEIRDFNWHRLRSHFKGLGQVHVRGKVEKEKLHWNEKTLNIFLPLFWLSRRDNPMSRKWMAYTVKEWSREVTVISLAPLGMMSQQGEPGSTGTLTERQGRRSVGKGEGERGAEGTCMVIWSSQSDSDF